MGKNKNISIQMQNQLVIPFATALLVHYTSALGIQSSTAPDAMQFG